MNYHPEMQSDVEPEKGTPQKFICDEYPNGIPEAIWYRDKYCPLYFNIDEPPKL